MADDTHVHKTQMNKFFSDALTGKYSCENTDGASAGLGGAGANTTKAKDGSKYKQEENLPNGKPYSEIVKNKYA